jgi:hypothetical protein
MASPLDRMNLRDYSEIVVLNAPYRLEPDLAMLRGVGIIREIKVVQGFRFLLAFVTRRTEVDALAAAVALKAEPDALVWIAFPKRSSPLYLSELSRDQGWEALSSAGFEADDELTVDPEWNALRFRRGAPKGKFARPARPRQAAKRGRGASGRVRPKAARSGAGGSGRGVRGRAGSGEKTGRTGISARRSGTRVGKSKARRGGSKAVETSAAKAAPRRAGTERAGAGKKTAPGRGRPARKAGAVRGAKPLSRGKGSGRRQKG